MYLLTRGDGRELKVSEVVWEAALALAFSNGWVPAGTSPSSPETASDLLAASQPRWDRLDYFSPRSQHVSGRDAHELASALQRALFAFHATVRPNLRDDGAAAVRAKTKGTERRRNLLRDVATFAHGGGFTIARG